MKQTYKRKIGRPSKFNDVIAVEIYDWITNGKSLNSFCKQEGKPTTQTVYNWLRANETFSDRYARARRVCRIRESETLWRPQEKQSACLQKY